MFKQRTRNWSRNVTMVQKHSRLNGRYLTLEPTSNGNLIVTLTDEGRELIEDLEGRANDSSTFYELFEDFACNGWEVLAADEIGALTDCQIIVSDDVARDENGIVQSVGACWWHERYQIEDFTEALKAGTAWLLKV